jgi:hypothetical protein
MKLEEEVILGERLLTISATPEEMQQHIEGRKLRLDWILLPAPDLVRDRYSEGVWIFNLTQGRWLKP